jgi:hypothetical protein
LRRAGLTVGAMTLVGVGLLVVALVLYERNEPPEQVVAISDLEASIDGVALGASETEVRRVYGEGEAGGEFAPLHEHWADIVGPTSLPAPGGNDLRRYENVVFMFGDNGVLAFVTSASGARTERGIDVGSSLDSARSAYPRVECGETTLGEGFFGESPTAPYCTTKLPRTGWLRFGGDPIRSITVSVAKPIQ